MDTRRKFFGVGIHLEGVSRVRRQSLAGAVSLGVVLLLVLCCGSLVAEDASGWPPSAGGHAAVGWLVVSLGAGALMVNQMIALVRGFRRTPAIEEEFVRRNECMLQERNITLRVAALEVSQNKLNERMTEALAHIEAAGEARAEKIHERVNLVLQKVSHIEGRMTGGAA